MNTTDTLKLALEALIHKANMIPVMQGNCYVIHPEAMQAVIDEAIQQALNTATPLAAPVQEPVAWLQIGLAPFHDGDVIARTSKPKAWNPEWWRFEPLYTAPPAAPVPLTDEQIVIIYKAWQAVGADIRGLFWGDFVREITLHEAAHGITKGQP